MQEPGTIVVRVGQKFFHKASRSIYTVTAIRDRDMALVREG